MMKPWLKIAYAAVLASFLWDASEAQTVANLIANPNLDIAGAAGPSTTDTAVPGASDVIIFHESAAADWQLVARRSGDFSIQTELVPSDGVAGTRMLHVRAHGVTFVELRPDLDTPPPTPHPAFFCAWVKVVRAGYAQAAIGGSGSGGVPTGAWQSEVATTPSATTNIAALTVYPATGSISVPGDVEFFVRSATFSLREQASCPQRTAGNLAAGAPRVNLPPRYPVIEHPQWTAPAPQGASPYGPGAYGAPQPNVLPRGFANGPAPNAKSNAPDTKQ